MIKTMTINLTYDDQSQMEKINFDDIIKGGKVTAIASYDLFKAMEIAEEVLDNSFDEACADARAAIDKVILGG